MTTKGTMTMTDKKAAPRKPNRNSTPQKILSAGLATAACVAVTGVIGVRSVSASEADTSTTTDASLGQQAAPVIDTTDAVAQLDAYAAQLKEERAALDAYRADLAKAARTFNRQVKAEQASSQGTAVRVATSKPSKARQPAIAPPARVSAPRPAKAPALAAPAQNQQRPQANTKGS